MRMTMQLQKLNSDQTGMASPRTYTNINRSYVGLVPYGTAPALPFFRYYDEDNESYTAMAQATSFAQWADIVGRSLMSLSDEHFYDVVLTAGFSTTEELNQ